MLVSSSAIPRTRIGPGIPSVSSSTGTDSSITNPISTLKSLELWRKCSTPSASGWTWVLTDSDSTPSRTSLRPRARTARTCQELTRSSSSCAPWSMKNTQAASCCVKLTSGLTTSSSILATVTNARWPSTFRSCHACTWDCVAVHGSALARSWLTPHKSRTAASGGPSCATTTNSPSKW